VADVFSKQKRSWIMSRIRGKYTKIDLRMYAILDGIGHAFEMYPRMYGNPDFVLRRKRIAIFCDGDFWHGYNYRHGKRPAGKSWRDKIERNMSRDARVSRNLRRDGWSVLRFWEHDIERDPEKCVRKIRSKLRAR